VRLLLVSYEFPPRGGPGVQRPLKLAKYLGRAGWDVTVLTVADPPTAIVDEGLIEELPPSVRVVRAWSLEPTRLVQALRRLRGDRKGTGGRVQGFSGAPSGVIALVQSVFVPDEKRGWKARAVRTGLAAARDGGFDVVLSSGPPHTSHLVGGSIAARLGVPHVMELRDPWFGRHSRRYLTPLQRWMDKRAEARVARRAAAIVTVTRAMGEMYRERYPHTRTEIILNGFDPEDLPEPFSADPDKLVFTHAGIFNGPRRPDTFLAGLALAEREDEAVSRDVRVVVAGAGAEFVEAARTAGVRSEVEALGYVSHERSLQTVAGADVAVLILSAGEESRVSLSGKVFEYIGLRKPILAVVGAGEAADLVQSLDGGTVAPFDDPRAIASAIIDIYQRWERGELTGPSEEQARRFSRVRQAEEYGALLESVRDER